MPCGPPWRPSCRSLRPALVRARFHLREEGDPGDVVATLERIRRRGRHGVLLKAPDHPLVARRRRRPRRGRHPDRDPGHRRAGQPAGLLRRDRQPRRRRHGRVPDHADERAASRAAVLMSLSSSTFRGEEEREAGFRRPCGARSGPPAARGDRDRRPGPHAPWPRSAPPSPSTPTSTPSTPSAAGTRRSWRPSGRAGRTLDHASSPTTWTATTSTLLRRRQLTAVLHHDLRRDLQEAARLILHARGVLPGRPWSRTVADPGDHAVQRARALIVPDAGARSADRLAADHPRSTSPPEGSADACPACRSPLPAALERAAGDRHHHRAGPVRRRQDGRRRPGQRRAARPAPPARLPSSPRRIGRRGRSNRSATRARRGPGDPAALGGARGRPGGAGRAPRREAGHRPARSPTASTTTSTWPSRSRPRT